MTGRRQGHASSDHTLGLVCTFCRDTLLCWKDPLPGNVPPERLVYQTVHAEETGYWIHVSKCTAFTTSTLKEKGEIDTQQACCDFFSCREIFKENPVRHSNGPRKFYSLIYFFEKLQLSVTALFAQPVIAEACAAIAWMPKHLHLVHKSIFSSKSFLACLGYLPCLHLVEFEQSKW